MIQNATNENIWFSRFGGMKEGGVNGVLAYRCTTKSHEATSCL
jgi:hypothetical protein